MERSGCFKLDRRKKIKNLEFKSRPTLNQMGWGEFILFCISSSGHSGKMKRRVIANAYSKNIEEGIRQGHKDTGFGENYWIAPCLVPV